MPEKIASLQPQPALPPGSLVRSETLRFDVLPARAVVRLQFADRAPKSLATLKVAGQPLAAAMNRWCGDDPAICRIEPDTFLLLSAQQAGADLVEAARLACGKRRCAMTDLSDAFATLVLEGAQAAAVLARGCSLDLRLAGFGPDACTRTRLAQLPVILRRTAPERFECLVDRAAAAWLYDWMQDAAIGLD